MPDELVEIDILGADPVKYIKNVTIFRDDTVGGLVLKAIGKEKITIVPESLTDLNKIPVFGRKADILILHRVIWKLQNGTFLVVWFAMPFIKNDDKYDSPDWW